MTLANILTLVRTLLFSSIIYFLYNENKFASLVILIFFILEIFLDLAEEHNSRKMIENKDVGSFLDPFIDKLILYSLLTIILLNFERFQWFLIFFLVRELSLISLRFISAKDNIVIPNDMFNKLMKISLRISILSFFIVNYYFTDYVSKSTNYLILILGYLMQIFFIAAVILSVFSIIYSVYNYFYKLKMESNKYKIIDKNIIILVNKKSRGYYNPYRRLLLKVFSKKRQAKIILLVNGKDIFQKIDKKIRNFKHIIIAGGDGTFEAALNHKSFKNKTLGFFPLGAGNAFYSYFYKGKGIGYLRKKFNFKEKKIDVLSIEWKEHKNKKIKKIESLFASIGLDADFINYSNKRTDNGLWDYFIGTVKTTFKAKRSYDIKISLNNKSKIHWDNCVSINFGKIPYYGYGIRSLVNLNDSDNLVHGSGCVNKHTKRFNKLLRVWGLILSHLGIIKSPLVKVKSKEINLESEELFPLQAGGEYLGKTKKIKIKISRKQKILII